MMIVSDFTPAINAPAIVPASKTPPRTPAVELKGIVRSRTGRSGDLFVVFTSGSFQWSVICQPGDLQSFHKFQAIVAANHDLWISHASQDEPRAARKREEWAYAVSEAYAKGAAL